MSLLSRPVFRHLLVGPARMAGSKIAGGTLTMKRFECRAVVFDLDGVLVDSTGYVELQWRRWAKDLRSGWLSEWQQ